MQENYFSQLRQAYLIAEIGVNHNGDLDLAREMVVAAKRAGADAVKFQTFRADQIATKEAKKAEYQIDNHIEENQYEMLKKLELSFANFRELRRYSDRRGIEFISTPYDIKSVCFLKSPSLICTRKSGI